MKYSYSHRIVERWNNLPKEIKEAPSINAFKIRFDANPKLVERFFEYDESGYWYKSQTNTTKEIRLKKGHN